MEALDSVSTLQSIILLTKRSVLIQSHDSDLCTSDQTKSVSNASSPREKTQSRASHHQHVDYRTGARLLCFKDGKSGSHESQQASTYGGEHQYKNWWMSTREPVPESALYERLYIHRQLGQQSALVGVQKGLTRDNCVCDGGSLNRGPP
jgi:hypothetical protein